MTKYKPYRNRNNASKAFANVFLWLFVLVFAVVIIANIADSYMPRNYYLKDLKVCEANIVEKASENDKISVRVNLTSNMPSEYVNSDDLWIQVTPEFSRKHNMNEKVGVLLGKYDVFKPKLLGSGQELEKSSWGIEEIYDTLKVAQEANPYSKFTTRAVVNKKKVTKNGDAFFVLSQEDRTFTTQVDKNILNKYEVGQEIECEFESIGESTKLIKVIG